MTDGPGFDATNYLDAGSGKFGRKDDYGFRSSHELKAAAKTLAARLGEESL